MIGVTLPQREARQFGENVRSGRCGRGGGLTLTTKTPT
jgi:hypothetical protein